MGSADQIASRTGHHPPQSHRAPEGGPAPRALLVPRVTPAAVAISALGVTQSPGAMMTPGVSPAPGAKMSATRILAAPRHRLPGRGRVSGSPRSTRSLSLPTTCDRVSLADSALASLPRLAFSSERPTPRRHASARTLGCQADPTSREPFASNSKRSVQRPWTCWVLRESRPL